MIDVDDDVIGRAIARFGVAAQEAVAIGELGELLAMFGRRAQGRDTAAEWRSEIADVLIMATSLALIHGRVGVQAEVNRKLDGLSLKLDRVEATP